MLCVRTRQMATECSSDSAAWLTSHLDVKRTHCLIKHPHERKPVPHRNIHTNDQPTIGAEVAEDGAHHGPTQGAHQADGRPVPARQQTTEDGDARRVRRTARLHPPPRRVGAADVGQDGVGAPRRRGGQDRGRPAPPPAPRTAPLRRAGRRGAEEGLVPCSAACAASA